MEEQQIIRYLTSYSDIWKEGVVVGCDPDVGITVVDKADHDIYVCCLIGPSAPQWRAIAQWPEHIKMAKFESIYKLWSGMITNGFWNSQIDDIQNSCVSSVSSPQSCPFGQ